MERRIRAYRQNKYAPCRHSLLSGLIITIYKFIFLLSVTVVILAIPSRQGWHSYMKLMTTESQLRQISILEGTYRHRDEVLTMSLKMATATEDSSWVKRYEEYGKREKPIIEQSWEIPEKSSACADAVLAIFAGDKLDEIEKRVIDLIRQDNYNYASKLLNDKEYNDERETYNRGMKSFVTNIRETLQERCEQNWKSIKIALIAVGVIIPVVIFFLLGLNQVGKYLKEYRQRKRQVNVFGKEWHETFDAITDAVSIIDIDKNYGKILQCNKAMMQFLKKPYEEVIDKSCCELIHGSTEPAKKCPLRRMLRTNRSESADFEIGDSWINIKVEPLIDDKGNLAGAIHVISDITKHRQANRAARDSENKFKLAFANAKDAIVWIDCESGLITNCNRACEELFGKRAKEIIGQPHTTLYPENKVESYNNLLSESRKGLNKNIEAQIQTKSGQIKEVTIAFSTMLVEDHEIIQGIIRDITDSKKAIKEIENLARFPSEDPNPVLRISSDCKILYSNDAGSPVLKTWQIEEDDQCLPEPWYTRIQEVYSFGNSASFELNCDDGHIFFITLQPIVEAGYINAYGLDITNRKKAEKEKTELELQLSQKQKMEAMGTLAGGIAHDFNNILAAVQGYVELSLDDLPEDNPVCDNLQQILACSNRAKKLVKQILTFSRKNEQEQEKELIRISSIIKEVLGMLRSSLPTTIKICRKIHAENSMVLADPTQIHQVLVNLCTNASHAMGETGGTLEVGLENVDFETETRISNELLKKGSYVKLSVSDTGCGMEKEVMERIFEPFFTTKKVNEGTGLGLPVVHGIIASHGGAITVNSTLGQGTTFEIFIPRIDNDQIQEQQSSEPENKKDKEVILLVDDEEMMVDVTGRILERLGYAVIAKTNSIDALEMFQEKPDEFDLIITDQVMPNMTGTQLAQNILSIRPDIPIILCTGFPENISSEEIKSIGIKELVFKPLSKEEIAAIVRTVLDNNKISV